MEIGLRGRLEWSGGSCLLYPWLPFGVPPPFLVICMEFIFLYRSPSFQFLFSSLEFIIFGFFGFSKVMNKIGL